MFINSSKPEDDVIMAKGKPNMYHFKHHVENNIYIYIYIYVDTL